MSNKTGLCDGSCTRFDPDQLEAARLEAARCRVEQEEKWRRRYMFSFLEDLFGKQQRKREVNKMLKTCESFSVSPFVDFNIALMF